MIFFKSRLSTNLWSCKRSKTLKRFGHIFTVNIRKPPKVFWILLYFAIKKLLIKLSDFYYMYNNDNNNIIITKSY